MKKASVIILAGQSNAVGVGHIKHLCDHFSHEKVAEYEKGYPDVLINYHSHDKRSGGFVPTTLNCSELTKQTFGPEVGMAEELHTVGSDEEFFIVKCAFGGSSLWNDWLSPTGGDRYDASSYADQVESVVKALDAGEPLRAGWAYNECVKLLNESLTELIGRGYSPKIRGFCWMQGESDACSAETADRYYEYYDALLHDFSGTFGEYLSDCIFVDAGISELWQHYRTVNKAKTDYAASHMNCVYIDTIAAGLTTNKEPSGAADLAHYDSDSVIKLGKLFTEALGIR